MKKANSTAVILPWEPIRISQDAQKEAAAMRAKMQKLSGPELAALKERFLDLVDTRRFCVVVNSMGVRHCFPVTEDAQERLEDLKKEYYSDYTEITDDEFHFFIGLHRAQKFMDLYASFC